MIEGVVHAEELIESASSDSEVSDYHTWGQRGGLPWAAWKHAQQWRCPSCRGRTHAEQEE